MAKALTVQLHERTQAACKYACREWDVPAHLKGKLYSPKDLFEAEMAKVDAMNLGYRK